MLQRARFYVEGRGWYDVEYTAPDCLSDNTLLTAILEAWRRQMGWSRWGNVFNNVVRTDNVIESCIHGCKAELDIGGPW